MIKVVFGDLLKANEDIIAHQVNCQGVMGSGIAKQIREKYPHLYDSYFDFCQGVHPVELLGMCQVVEVQDQRHVANLFGQLNYGRSNQLYTNYGALENALKLLKWNAQARNLSIAIPHGIGCGLANGDWKGVVKPMIHRVFSDYDITIYRYVE